MRWSTLSQLRYHAPKITLLEPNWLLVKIVKFASSILPFWGESAVKLSPYHSIIMTVTIFFRCSNRNRISASKVARTCLPFLPFIFAVLCQFLGPKFCFKQGWGDIGRCYFEQSVIDRRISSPPQLDG